MTVPLKPLLIFVALAFATGCHAQPGPGGLLGLERTIALKDVRGRIDHLAVDVQHRRLFVAELGNGSVEAIDLAMRPASFVACDRS